MAEPTFFWHDYETSGLDTARDRPLQFAGIRTTLDLQPTGEPVMAMCRLPADILPHPEASLLTGISPQQANREGMSEFDFAAMVHDELGAPGTCGVGFNSLRFDDHVTRHLLYRNFHDPYAREWQHGNSRWDIIDLVRMCYALRPDGLEWPRKEDGTASFRLEDLARANQLEHGKAHDALSDVEATLGLARLIRDRQPRLWQWYLKLRDKKHARAQLDVVNKTPLVHVSSRFPASHGHLSLILPLAEHPSRSNEVVVYDLSADPGDLLALPAEELAKRIFVRKEELPEGVERIALRTVRCNQSPALAPLGVLQGVDVERIGLDVGRCMAHAKILQAGAGLADKARRVFDSDKAPAEDPELALYDGFPDNADKALCQRVRATPADGLAALASGFHDPRYATLLFRYRARNWPESLSPDERDLWQKHCRDRLSGDSPLTSISLAAYFDAIAQLRSVPSANNAALLDQLETFGREQAAAAGLK